MVESKNVSQVNQHPTLVNWGVTHQSSLCSHLPFSGVSQLGLSLVVKSESERKTISGDNFL